MSYLIAHISTFLSTSPLRGTTPVRRVASATDTFLSTSPLRGTTAGVGCSSKSCEFLSTSPLRGTTQSRSYQDKTGAFLSTSPLRGTTAGVCKRRCVIIFLSTSPLRGTTKLLGVSLRLVAISIHVPLAGDDTYRSPRNHLKFKFLSTSPLRGTTVKPIRHYHRMPYFYPRPPCGGRQCDQKLLPREQFFISIHVPLAGDDCLAALLSDSNPISIHVPLAGDDADGGRGQADN